MALSTDAARATPRFREAYEKELRNTLAAIDEPFNEGAGNTQRTDEATALMALCVGGISLSRAVNDEVFSACILRICPKAVATLANASDAAHTQKRGST